MFRTVQSEEKNLRLKKRLSNATTICLEPLITEPGWQWWPYRLTHIGISNRRKINRLTNKCAAIIRAQSAHVHTVSSAFSAACLDSAAASSSNSCAIVSQQHVICSAATCGNSGTASYTHLTVKVKLSRYRPGVAQRVGTGIVLLFHDRGTRRG
jgi:hypothetical protein